jgi:hypothetical protein
MNVFSWIDLLPDTYPALILRLFALTPFAYLHHFLIYVL